MSRILIGRDPSCNVVLNSPNVSRHHALLDSDGYNVTITDLNSTNGTYVNGVRINSQTILQPNDVVAICGNIIPWQQYINQLSTTQNAQFIGQNSNIGTTKRGSGLLALWISLGSTIFVASVIGIVLLLSSQAKQQNIDNGQNLGLYIDSEDDDDKKPETDSTFSTSNSQSEATTPIQDPQKKELPSQKRNLIQKEKQVPAQVATTKEKDKQEGTKKQESNSVAQIDEQHSTDNTPSKEDDETRALFNQIIERLDSEQLQTICGILSLPLNGTPEQTLKAAFDDMDDYMKEVIVEEISILLLFDDIPYSTGE